MLRQKVYQDIALFRMGRHLLLALHNEIWLSTRVESAPNQYTSNHC
jgi:hypothetical protein